MYTKVCGNEMNCGTKLRVFIKKWFGRCKKNETSVEDKERSGIPVYFYNDLDGMTT